MQAYLAHTFTLICMYNVYVLVSINGNVEIRRNCLETRVFPSDNKPAFLLKFYVNPSNVSLRDIFTESPCPY